MKNNKESLNLLKESIENETSVKFDTLEIGDMLLSVDKEEFGRYELFKIVQVDKFLFLIHCDGNGNLIKSRNEKDILNIDIESHKEFILNNLDYIQLNTLRKKAFRDLANDYSFTKFCKKEKIYF
ncbi:TPA: hypothetical protein KON86_002859 [Clostridioides difficile]|uniref:hypothetical protein n=1 Tax=Clostridioides difficile TaxID=1496 RepID=UPI001C14D144|nr:hypothetical protein [Clostridioides difficile]MDW0092594.1 hypothetical protein [Clostridioides difficile]HBF4443227.1 hypothetical protein [Clostridioides difficile]HBG1420761.1 hypothetical protein [Clostridioides difficile]HBG5350123.1 hypothetical protein [Clostridioides difficile]